MKKIISMIAAAVITVCGFTGCTQEKMDTFVQWGFAKDTDSEIVNGFETMLSSSQVIFNAFDQAFFSDYTDLKYDGHTALMKAQEGKSKAAKNAKKTAEKAHSMIDKDHVCPADYIFVVRIRYDSDEYETVWSHDYRAKE